MQQDDWMSKNSLRKHHVPTELEQHSVKGSEFEPQPFKGEKQKEAPSAINALHSELADLTALPLLRLVILSLAGCYH
jgi:hypothetical protein